MALNRRTFIKGALASTALIGTGAGLYACGIERHCLDQTTVPLSLGLNKPLRIAVLGDIHFDPLYEEAYLDLVARSLSGLRADLILYTGDFISHTAARMKDLARLLSKATSRLGSYAVLGNHDHWYGAHIVRTALESQGVGLLVNRSLPLPDEEAFFLTGVESFWAGIPDLTIFSRTPRHARHIVLVHEPDAFAQLSDPRIKLQISGHTHGGQVRVPFLGALVLPKWGKDYDAGLFNRNGRYLYVNRGIGTLSPHVRFDCRPEVTLFELT